MDTYGDVRVHELRFKVEEFHLQPRGKQKSISVARLTALQRATILVKQVQYR